MYVHVGDCWSTGKRSKVIERDKDLRALAEGVKPCPQCRPDTALGVLDQALRSRRPDVPFRRGLRRGRLVGRLLLGGLLLRQLLHFGVLAAGRPGFLHRLICRSTAARPAGCCSRRPSTSTTYNQYGQRSPYAPVVDQIAVTPLAQK
ncbi:DUF6233 domain-containing protein [Streptomyces sp. NL15-2K]|uniref:DUF6233 domain-containing protein n=1 Tax=Streptomyces sp. NL15-2K TaxID=376149 RepID=UPI00278BE0BC|nr:DUF6233 domain-containing protein [Streptomyces sp. NL15-2K]